MTAVVNPGTFPWVHEVEFYREPSRPLPAGGHRIGSLSWTSNPKTGSLSIVRGIGLRIAAGANRIPGFAAAPQLYVAPAALPDVWSLGDRFAIEVLWSSPTPLAGSPWTLGVGLIAPGQVVAVDHLAGWSSRLGWGGTNVFTAASTGGFASDGAVVTTPTALGSAWALCQSSNTVRTYMSSTTRRWPSRAQWNRAGALSFGLSGTAGTDPAIFTCGPWLGLTTENVVNTSAVVFVRSIRIRIV